MKLLYLFETFQSLPNDVLRLLHLDQSILLPQSDATIIRFLFRTSEDFMPLCRANSNILAIRKEPKSKTRAKCSCKWNTSNYWIGTWIGQPPLTELILLVSSLWLKIKIGKIALKNDNYWWAICIGRVSTNQCFHYLLILYMLALTINVLE